MVGPSDQIKEAFLGAFLTFLEAFQVASLAFLEAFQAASLAFLEASLTFLEAFQMAYLTFLEAFQIVTLVAYQIVLMDLKEACLIINLQFVEEFQKLVQYLIVEQIMKVNPVEVKAKLVLISELLWWDQMASQSFINQNEPYYFVELEEREINQSLPNHFSSHPCSCFQLTTDSSCPILWNEDASLYLLFDRSLAWTAPLVVDPRNSARRITEMEFVSLIINQISFNF